MTETQVFAFVVVPIVAAVYALDVAVWAIRQAREPNTPAE